MMKTLEVMGEAIRNPKHPFRKTQHHSKKSLKNRHERRKIREYPATRRLDGRRNGLKRRRRYFAAFFWLGVRGEAMAGGKAFGRMPSGFVASKTRSTYFINNIWRARLMAVVMRRW